MIDIQMDKEEEQFILKIKGTEVVEYSDFYYFVIDNGIIEERNILIENQIENLKSWKSEILNLQSGEVFLPFDFSDQYLGCLTVSKENNGYKMGYVFFRSINGAYPSYSRPFIPSKYGAKSEEILAPTDVNIQELVSDIENIISSLQDKF